MSNQTVYLIGGIGGRLLRMAHYVLTVFKEDVNTTLSTTLSTTLKTLKTLKNSKHFWEWLIIYDFTVIISSKYTLDRRHDSHTARDRRHDSHTARDRRHDSRTAMSMHMTYKKRYATRNAMLQVRMKTPFKITYWKPPWNRETAFKRSLFKTRISRLTNCSYYHFTAFTTKLEHAKRVLLFLLPLYCVYYSGPVCVD
jgi:hypothetical protein